MAQEHPESQYTEPSGEAWPIVRAQPRSFFKAPLCTDLDQLDADVALFGVPFDQGTLGRPGARFGPDAIRDAPRTYSYMDPYGAQREAEGLFDIDVEDERFIMVSLSEDSDGASGSQINVILNWFEELKERVPVP